MGIRHRHLLGALVAGCLVLRPTIQVTRAETPATTSMAEQEVRHTKAALLLEHWHTLAYLQSWRDQLAKAMNVPPGVDKEMEERLRADWKEAVLATYNAKSMFEEMRNDLARDMPLADIEAGIRFADTDTGRRIRAALKPPATPLDDEAAAARAKAAADALAKKPGRRSIVRDLNVAMDNVEATVSVLINFSLGSAIGVAATLPQGAPQLDPEDLLRLIEQSRSRMRAGIAEHVEGHVAALLEPVGDDDLEQYLQELTTPSGKRYVDVSNRAFEQALRRQAIAIGSAFARNLRAQKL